MSGHLWNAGRTPRSKYLPPRNTLADREATKDANVGKVSCRKVVVVANPDAKRPRNQLLYHCEEEDVVRKAKIGIVRTHLLFAEIGKA